MTVVYEWDVELVLDGEVVEEHYHQESYDECVDFVRNFKPVTGELQIVLVRDDDKGRSWAYVENGNLPDFFEDAYFHKVAKVPKKYHIKKTNSATGERK